MALSKAYVDARGVTTNYHRIGNVSLFNNTLQCSLKSYVSRDYREQEQVAGTVNFRFPITVEEEESMGIRALCYTKIKGLEAWADAEDC